MRNACILAVFLIPAGSRAQSVIAPPQLGFVADGARALRPVYGVAGSFVLGPAVAGDVADAAFSSSLGLLKTDSSLAAFDAQGKLLTSVEAPAGRALFAFSADGTAALAYLSSSRVLMEWRSAGFVPVPLHSETAGSVIGMALPSSDEAVLVVERERGLWELHVPLNRDGTPSQNALPGIHPPVLPLVTGGLLYAEEGAIVIRRPDGSEARLGAPLPKQFSLQSMNRDWVELADLQSRARFAIRTAAGGEAFYRLPEQATGPNP